MPFIKGSLIHESRSRVQSFSFPSQPLIKKKNANAKTNSRGSHREFKRLEEEWHRIIKKDICESEGRLYLREELAESGSFHVSHTCPSMVPSFYCKFFLKYGTNES